MSSIRRDASKFFRARRAGRGGVSARALSNAAPRFLVEELEARVLLFGGSIQPALGMVSVQLPAPAMAVKPGRRPGSQGLTSEVL